MSEDMMKVMSESELDEIAGGASYMENYVTYTVVKGDNLTKIAKKFGTTWKKIYAANRDKIKNPDLIQIGWELKIPQ